VKGTKQFHNIRQNIRQCRNGSFLLVSNDGVLWLLNGWVNALHKLPKSRPSFLILISKDEG
jgi:type III secretory pathway component EscV